MSDGRGTSNPLEEDYEELKRLLERFLEKSDELERKEDRVMDQVEKLHLAIATLKRWNERRKSHPQAAVEERYKFKKIEEETERIMQETERIQNEVRQKIEENKKLEDQILKKKILINGHADNMLTASLVEVIKKEAINRKRERIELESRALKSRGLSELTVDPGIQFFQERMQMLKELEEKLEEKMEEKKKKASEKER